MGRSIGAALLLPCLFALAQSSVAADNAAAPARIEIPDAGRALAPEWKDGWEKTYHHNHQRWEDGLARVEGGEALLRRSLIELLDALRQKYPDDGRRCRRATLEIAEHETWLGERAAAARRLRALAGECRAAGDGALEAESLRRVIEWAWWEDRIPRDADEDFDVVAQRIVELWKAAAIGADHAALESAARVLIERPIAEGRFWEASKSLAMLETSETQRGDSRWKRRRTALLRAVGTGESSEESEEDAPARVAEPGVLQAWNLQSDLAAALAPGAPFDPARLQALVLKAADTDELVPLEPGLYTSPWVRLDRALTHAAADSGAAALEALRREQERLAAAALRMPSSDESLAAAARRFPFAAGVNRALLAAAERDIGHGRAGSARRAFEHVRAHTADKGLRTAAQAGLWLAVACAARTPRELDAVFDGVAPDTLYPWMGTVQSAAAIRARLQNSLRSAPPVPARELSTLPIDALRIPPVHPWNLGPNVRFPLDALPDPCGRIIAEEDLCILAGPHLLACFGAPHGGVSPVWIRRPCARDDGGERQREDDARRARLVPGDYKPALAHGTIYTRWGLDGGAPAALAAFDARTGLLRWSTAGDKAWEGLAPAADPVPSEGRIYVTAVRTDDAFLCPVSLVCLADDSGAVLWRRSLGTYTRGVGQRSGARRVIDGDVDLATWGSAVTVAGGAVYVAMNLGFVARCDARDGRVEWLRTYARAGTGADSGARRRGSPPCPAAGALIAVPRDRSGAIALDMETGAVLWENAFLPSEEIVGAVGDALVLADARTLLAVDARTGNVRWERMFESGLVGRPQLTGSDALVGTAAGLERIALANGETLERRPWPAGERPAQFALAGHGIAVFGPGGIEPAAAGGQAAAPPGRVARIEGSHPRFWAPAAQGAPAERVYVLADRVLRAIDAAAPYLPRWIRLVDGDVRDILLCGEAVLLLERTRVTALDTRTGAFLWERETTSRLDKWFHSAGTLVLVAMQDRRECLALDATTGAPKWRRALGGGDALAATLVAHSLHMILDGPPRNAPRSKGLTHLLLDAESGAVLGERAVLGIRRGEDLRAACAGGSCFILPGKAPLVEIDLARGTETQRPIEKFDARRVRRLYARDQWLLIEAEWERREGAGDEGGRRPRATLILEAGGSRAPRCRTAWGSLQGNAFLEPEGFSVRSLELDTGAERTLTAPFDPERVDGAVHAAACRSADRVWLLSSAGRRGSGHPGLRIDSFDAHTGMHLATAAFPDIALGANGGDDDDDDDDDRGRGPEDDVLVAGGALWIAHPMGVDVIAAAHPTGDARRSAAAHAIEQVRIDGVLDEWDPASGLSVEVRGGGIAKLIPAHDGSRLLLGLRLPGAPVRLPARLDAAPGCSLHVGLSGRDSRRYVIDLGRPGEPVWTPLQGDRLPEAAEAAVRRNAATGEIVCEVAVPLEDLVDFRNDVRTIGLSLAVYDERTPGLQGPTAAWGAGLARDRLFAGAHQTIYLSSIRTTAGDGMQRVLDAAPELPAAFAHFLRNAALRAASAGDLTASLVDFTRRHPTAVTVPRLLAMERALRLLDAPNAPETLAGAARAAGVPEAVVRRYELQASAVLTQWVYLDGEEVPRSIELGFFDGLGPPHREHGVYFLKRYQEWGPPLPRLPCRLVPREWSVLRIPLALAGLNDVPITGAWFTQQGPAQIVWGPCSVTMAGKETPLFPDACAGGTTSASLTWLHAPARDGIKSHAGPVPRERYEIVTHSIRGLRPEAEAHVRMPDDGPLVCQRVYIDPAHPPRTIALSFDDGRRSGPLLVWGEKRNAGRRVGPLPKAGTPAELRVPLEWTGLADLPILGIAFGADGGAACWGPTVLELGGTKVAMLAGGSDGRSAALPMPEGVAGPCLVCDGATALEFPDAPALEPATFALEAWFLNKEALRGREKRRWLVNKNTHEETAGHYALMIRGTEAGAYLNIAGKPGRPFSAWTPPGKVAPGKWHHIVMTFDGAELVVYLDGEREAVTAVGKARQVGTGTFAIGKRADGYAWFRGLIDEVVLYSRPLSAEEVRTRFTRRGAASDGAAAVAAHFSFDDVSRPAEGVADAVWDDAPPGVKPQDWGAAKSHTHAPGDAYASHRLCTTFRAHLGFDRECVAAAVQTAFPALAGLPEARLFLIDALRLFPDDAARRAELCLSYVRAQPAHRSCVEVLGLLAEARGGIPGIVDTCLTEAQAAWDVAYAFRRTQGGTPGLLPAVVKVIDPVPEAMAGAAPPAFSDAEVAAWETRTPEAGIVRLGSARSPDPRIVYAAAWVAAQKACDAVLEVDEGDCDVRAYVGGALVIDRERPPAALPPASAAVAFPAGTSKILLRIEMLGPGAAFGIEIVDRAGRGAPADLAFTSGPTP